MVDRNLRLEITGKPFGHLAGNPVLSKRGLNKNIYSYNKQEQGQEKPLQYFFKSPQSQLFKVQK